MIIKKPQFFLISFLTWAFLGSFCAQADLFDDEPQNSLNQNSLNTLSSELQDLEHNSNYSQIYTPLPKAIGTEWNDEVKIAKETNELDESSDEIKRKEAAIMRDLEEHAKPLDENIASPEVKGPKQDKPLEEKKAPVFQPGPKEFKPRVRVR